jgi:hypothetical protein
MRTMFGLAASRPEAETAIEVNNIRKNFMMKVLVFREPRFRFFEAGETHPVPGSKKTSSRNGE